MARNPDIRYINLYAEGSAARVLEPRPRKKRAALPRAPKKRARVIHVDVMAVGGIVMAVALTVTMIFGLCQLRSMNRARDEMESYVCRLRNENSELRYTYENSYDLERVRQIAAGAGYVPVEEVTVIEIPAMPQQNTTQMSFWEKITAFFVKIFA